MIISEKHKFVFIHIPKVAGQSITNALMPHASTRWQKALNCCVPYRYQTKIFTKLKQYSGNRIAFMPQPYDDHAAAKEIIDDIGMESFRNYFSFAFVRNPWSWVLSNYTYAKKNPRHYRHELVNRFSDFDSYCRWHCSGEDNYPKQNRYVCDEDGKIIVSFLGKQESINEDFQRVMSSIGLPYDLPKLNVSNKKPFTEYYSDELREIVAKYYADDIELFDYKFE